jgi:hypothetical protein
MTTEERKIKIENGCGAFYGFGFLGAAIYFIKGSLGFWGAIFGLLKAVFWPAILVYKVFEMMRI